MKAESYTRRPAARAIVIRDGKLLAMRRNKYGKRYMTLVGGRLEQDETPEQAVIREAQEETGLILANPELKFVEYSSGDWGEQYIFLCEYVSGEPKLGSESEEYARTKLGENTYEPEWVEFSELQQNSIPFRSERLRKEIIKSVEIGFSESVKRWTP